MTALSMRSPAPWLPDQMASVTVTFNPDIAILAKQLDSLAAVQLIVIVDNGSQGEAVTRLRGLALQYDAVVLIESAQNGGLALGLNVGLRYIREVGYSFRAVLLLDQDSTFAPAVPHALLEALKDIELATGKPACVGPEMMDPDAGMGHGFHVIANRWRWARSYPAAGGKQPISVATLNGSGSTFSMSFLDIVGLLDEELFIDHVDTEWSFRASSSGCQLFGIPWVRMDHRMGENSRRVWLLGWRLWPDRSPLRHYFLFRNTIRLIRRAYVPKVWKTWALLKMVADLVVTIITDSRRRDQLLMMFRGIRAGLHRI